ncbi:MAG TPA: hypothetical protein VI790_03460 [Candidatus Nanoarchaeia archaeon]|nr:MAG: hypothetical protein A2355_00660 [Spirochaetes bacterium RIFOXYB1_FULL_32_8]HLE06386.1 hypothetical protein [Candidatus Nanoarchaeia archaeon]
MELIEKLNNWDNLNSSEQIDLTKMVELDLSNLSLLKLPESIRELKRLKIIYLDNNLLTRLPDWFSEIIELRYVYMDNNPLIEFPEKVLINIKNKYNNLGCISIENTLIPKFIAYQTRNYNFMNNLFTTNINRKEYEDINQMILKNLGYEINNEEYETNKESIEHIINNYPFHTLYINNQRTKNHFLKRAYNELLPQNDELKKRMLCAIGINAAITDYQNNREVMDNLLIIYLNKQTQLIEYIIKHLSDSPLTSHFYDKLIEKIKANELELLL